mgnify:CR=1 FL=1
MEIRRLHANLNDFNDGVFEISGDEFNYAVKVLRQKQGFSVIVNVGDGKNSPALRKNTGRRCSFLPDIREKSWRSHYLRCCKDAVYFS